MNNIPNHQAAPASVEELVTASCCQVREGIRRSHQRCEERIRKSPTGSVLGAVGIGYLLHLLPVRVILVTVVRLLTAIAPPVLFLFGAAKLIGLLQREKSVKEASTEDS